VERRGFSPPGSCDECATLLRGSRETLGGLPYVHAVRIDASSKQLLSEPDIWSNTTAYAYPDACPNNACIVGLSLFQGGGPSYPSHLIGLADGTGWELSVVRAGTSGPDDGKWGDYVTCRPHLPDGGTFAATGFTLQGDGSRLDIEVRYVQFGP
jgi:hypothetical protein